MSLPNYTILITYLLTIWKKFYNVIVSRAVQVYCVHGGFQSVFSILWRHQKLSSTSSVSAAAAAWWRHWPCWLWSPPRSWSTEVRSVYLHHPNLVCLSLTERGMSDTALVTRFKVIGRQLLTAYKWLIWLAGLGRVRAYVSQSISQSIKVALVAELLQG